MHLRKPSHYLLLVEKSVVIRKAVAAHTPSVQVVADPMSGFVVSELLDESSGQRPAPGAVLSVLAVLLGEVERPGVEFWQIEAAGPGTCRTGEDYSTPVTAHDEGTAGVAQV